MKLHVRLFLGLAVLFCALAATMSAQPASARWIDTANATFATPVIQGNVTAPTQIIQSMGINQYTGTDNSQRLYSTGSGTGYWPADADQNSSRYTQYAISPQTSMNLAVSSISLNLGDNIGNQTLQVNVYYYVGTDTTNFLANATQLNTSPQYTRVANVSQTPSYAPNITVNNGQTLYVRVYPWYTVGAASGKYIYIYNVKISGTVTPIPVYAAATWPLLTNGSATVAGLISAGNIAFDGTNLYHYGYGAAGDRWTNHLPSNGAWPAETSPNFSRYAQFRVAPQTGGTFYADTIRYTQVVEFTNNLRVALYYSNDSTFATQTFVADTIVPAVSTSYQYLISPDTVATGQSMYLRFYPYDITGDPSFKLEDVTNVMVSGATTGLAILAPSVTTRSASYISTTFLTTGGSVTADGGGTVTARGVCWNTTGSPTLADSYTTDGSGLGTYTSSVTGLTAGATYYISAYATNIGGTAYAAPISITTLASVVPPAVTTTSVSSILAATAVSGGNVTTWGGAAVTARGVCWNTDTTLAYPAITDGKTLDGTDIGSYTSGLTGLSASTMYFIRAYATNSAGTAYGSLLSFTTQATSPDTTVVVAQDGSGTYTTIQAAFRAVPTNYTGKWTIFVKKGKYHEKDTLAAGKINVVLVGEDRDSTIIWNDNFSDMYGTNNPGTSGTFTVAIDASDFTAKNITIANTYWPNRYGTVTGTQGVALRTQGDRHEYLNCKFIGYQDTYYTWGGSGAGRMYHKNCLIIGTVDFIFGRDVCVFDSCTILMEKSGGSITAGATDPGSQYGYVFRNCLLLADTTSYTDSSGYAHTPSTNWYLGRPWQSNPRVVYMQCYEPATLATAGWTTMSVNPTLFAEYNCSGPGFTTARGTVSAWPSGNQPRQLTNTEAATYTLSTIFARSSTSSSLVLSDWMPASASTADNMPVIITAVGSTQSSVVPKEFGLKSFPNPFNPTTTISYDVPKTSRVTVKVYDLFGREIATIADGVKSAGTYQVVFNANRLATGVYFVRAQFNGASLVKRMLLLK